MSHFHPMQRMRFSPEERHSRFAYFAEVRENMALAKRDGFTSEQAFQIALQLTDLRTTPPLVSHDNAKRKSRHQALVQRVVAPAS